MLAWLTLLIPLSSVAASQPDAAALYEAYNGLHALSQSLAEVPIDSPTVVVVRRRADRTVPESPHCAWS